MEIERRSNRQEYVRKIREVLSARNSCRGPLSRIPAATTPRASPQQHYNTSSSKPPPHLNQARGIALGSAKLPLPRAPRSLAPLCSSLISYCRASMFSSIYSKVSSKLTGGSSSGNPNLSSKYGNPTQPGLSNTTSSGSADEDDESTWMSEEARVIFNNLDMHFITSQIIAMSRISPPPTASSPAQLGTNDSPQGEETL